MSCDGEESDVRVILVGDLVLVRSESSSRPDRKVVSESGQESLELAISSERRSRVSVGLLRSGISQVRPENERRGLTNFRW